MFNVMYEVVNNTAYKRGMEKYVLPFASNDSIIPNKPMVTITTSAVHFINSCEQEQKNNDNDSPAPPSAPPSKRSFQEEFRTATSSPFLRANNATKKYSVYVVNGNELKHMPLRAIEEREPNVSFKAEEIKRIRNNSK